MRRLVLGIVGILTLITCSCARSVPLVDGKGFLYVNWNKTKYPRDNVTSTMLDICKRDYLKHNIGNISFWEAYNNDHHVFLAFSVDDMLDTFVVYILDKGVNVVICKFLVSP